MRNRVKDDNSEKEGDQCDDSLWKCLEEECDTKIRIEKNDDDVTLNSIPTEKSQSEQTEENSNVQIKYHYLNR